MLPQTDIDFINNFVRDTYLSRPVFSGAYNNQGKKKDNKLKGLVDRCVSPNAPSGVEVKKELDALDKAEAAMFRGLVQLLRELYPGVDETMSGLVTYRGFGFRTNGAGLLGRAQEAVAQVQELASQCSALICNLAAFSGYNSQGGAASADLAWTQDKYKLYLDKSAHYGRLEKVKAIFGRLNHAVNNCPLEIICDSDPTNPKGVCTAKEGIFAFVKKHEGRNRFYLSSKFFNAQAADISGSCSFVAPTKVKPYAVVRDEVYSALDAATCTMLHELTHITAIGDTEDNPNPIDAAECLKNALHRPEIACNNAENYSMFAKAVLMRRRFPPPRNTVRI